MVSAICELELQNLDFPTYRLQETVRGLAWCLKSVYELETSPICSSKSLVKQWKKCFAGFPPTMAFYSARISVSLKVKIIINLC